MGKHRKRSKKHKKKSKPISEDEWVEADSVRPSTDSSPEVRIKKRKKHRQSSSSESSEDPAKTNQMRDDWMSLPTNFQSFSNQDSRKLKDEQKKRDLEEEKYNPSTSSKELNKYWKNDGDGLPKFQKPRQDEEDDRRSQSIDKNKRRKSSSSESYRRDPHRRDEGFQKPRNDYDDYKESKSRTTSRESNWRKQSKPAVERVETKEDPKVAINDELLTEKDLNLLAGKLVKAEIIGNKTLIAELKDKLEKGRISLQNSKAQDQDVMLTQYNRQGQSKPLTLEGSNYPDRKRKKAVSTHSDNQRVRYFPDDDKYNLKQMFEAEKFNTADDQEADFMKAASTLRKNDDLEDFFADGARRKKSDSKDNEKAKNRAINEHQKMSTSLDNCQKCIQSSTMQKHLIVSLGEYVYLALPAHEPLVDGHCLIVPIRHTTSCTQLDENEWNEINDFRKALIRMFGKQQKEIIFYEVAMGFHKYPHTALECIPMEVKDMDLAPMYFKKAIDESETEWSQNKKLVQLKNRDVRLTIPKELAYFFVNFGINDGFAHVIEDEQLFPKNFAQEIIGGIMDLHHSLWRKPNRQSFDVQSKRVLEFSNEWKHFDCTVQN